MGSSYVSPNEAIPGDRQEAVVGVEYGFWVRDDLLAQFLAAMREEISNSSDTPEWLRTLSEHWPSVTEAQYGTSCELIFPRDMRFDDEAKAAIFSASRRVLGKALAAGGDYAAAYLLSQSVSDLPTDVSSLSLSDRLMFLEVGMRLCDLTCGMIETGERGAGIVRRPEKWVSC